MRKRTSRDAQTFPLSEIKPHQRPSHDREGPVRRRSGALRFQSATPVARSFIPWPLSSTSTCFLVVHPVIHSLVESRGMRNRRERPDWLTPSVISFQRNVMTELKKMCLDSSLVSIRSGAQQTGLNREVGRVLTKTADQSRARGLPAV